MIPKDHYAFLENCCKGCELWDLNTAEKNGINHHMKVLDIKV